MSCLLDSSLPSLPSNLLDTTTSLPDTFHDIKVWKKCPPGHEYAVVNHITFNLAFDGVDVFQTSNKGSVYIITLTVNNAQGKFRNMETGTYRIAVLPHSDGEFSEPFSRAALGAMIKHIRDSGKEGLYIEEDGVLYHVYFSIHAYVADLKAAMQLYDRPNCTKTFQPCLTHGCVYASYDVITRSYVHPDQNPCVFQEKLKTMCRSLTHFHSSSIWRVFPVVASYASDVFYPPSKFPAKKDQILDILRGYMKCELSSEDEKKVLDMFAFARGLGHNFFMRQNVEAGECEREPFVIDRSEDDKKAYLDRRYLVNLSENSPLPLDAAYGCEYMHAMSNISETINTYLLNKAYTTKEKEDDIYSSILFFLNGCKPCNELTEAFLDVPSFIKDGISSFLNDCQQCGRQVLKDKDYTLANNFKALNSHTKMLWAFQYFPLLFSKSLHYPVVRLVAYIFMILSELFNLDKDLNQAKELNHLLYLCFGALEGITPNDLFTLSMHVPLHSFHSICNSGPLLYTNTFATESGYRWDKENNRPSANRMKTIGKRVIIHSFLSFYSMIKNLGGDKKESSLCFTGMVNTFIDFFSLNDIQLVTKRNYQDSYAFFRCDMCPFVTGLDLFIMNNHSVPANLKYDEYYDSSIWNDVEWYLVKKQFKRVTFQGEYYYSFSYTPSTCIDSVLSSTKHFAFVRGWDRKIHLFIMLAFFDLKICGHDFPQSICYHVKTSPIIASLPGVSILRIAKGDLYRLDTRRLCIINLDRLNHNQGSFYWTHESDEVYFITDKLITKQFRMNSYGSCYLTVPPSQ